MTTRAELFNLNTPLKSLDNAFQALLPKIEAAGKAYAEERIAAEKDLNDLRVKLGSTRVSIESPVNLAKSHAKIMPLASDSLSLDVEYVALDADRKNLSFYMNNINLLVRSSASRLGPSVWSQIAEPIQRAVAHRLETHKVAGTLVICASCTHKSSCVLAPLVLDVDKAMNVWNALFPEDPCDAREMQRLADGSPEAVQNKFGIVAGMRFGSIFVGMAHLMHEKAGPARRPDVGAPRPRSPPLDARDYREQRSQTLFEDAHAEPSTTLEPPYEGRYLPPPPEPDTYTTPDRVPSELIPPFGGRAKLSSPPDHPPPPDPPAPTESSDGRDVWRNHSQPPPGRSRISFIHPRSGTSKRSSPSSPPSPPVPPVTTERSRRPERLVPTEPPLVRPPPQRTWDPNQKELGGYGMTITEEGSLVGNTNRLLSEQLPFPDINVVSLGVIPSVSPKEYKSEPSRRSDAQRRDVPDDRYGSYGPRSIRDRLEEKVEGAEQLPGMDSLMAALDDYLAKAANGSSGIPISYDLKDITKSHLAGLWAAKQRNGYDPNIF